MTWEKFSLVVGSGCIDLRRDAALPLLGFMWNDLSDMALRKGSVSPCRGEVGAGEDSRDVLRVPGPEVEVALETKEKRERPRRPSSCTWCCDTGVEASEDNSTD